MMEEPSPSPEPVETPAEEEPTPAPVTRIGGRAVPHDLGAEAAVLGAMIIDNSVIGEVALFLEEAHFYLPAHRDIYRAIVTLEGSGSAVDLVLLRNQLRGEGSLERVGGVQALLAIGEAVPSSANVMHYARIVREKGLVRKLIQTAGEVIETAFGWEGEAAQLVDEAEARVFQLSEQSSTKEAERLSDVLFRDTVDRIEAIHDPDRAPDCCTTGYYELNDKLAGGFHPGELVIIGGRPSMGKTSFALNCALNLARTDGKPIGIFSLEVAREQVAMNMLCMDARIDVSMLRKGLLSEGEQQRAIASASKLAQLPILIDDTTGLGIYKLRAKARRLRQRHRVELIIVDYLQLMEGSGQTGGRSPESRQVEISEISRGLKGLARELHVPVVALSQLNRSVDQREGHRPRMSDLRESGAIEQDADVILFLYREDRYQQDSPEQGIAEVIIGKQRNGPTDTLKVAFLKEYMRFENLSVATPP